MRLNKQNLMPMIYVLVLISCGSTKMPDCIDESQISDGPCTMQYDPVCGCDGKSYGMPAKQNATGSFLGCRANVTRTNGCSIAVGIHFSPMAYSFGKILLFLSIACIVNAVVGLLFPRIPYESLGIMDSLFKKGRRIILFRIINPAIKGVKINADYQ